MFHHTNNPSLRAEHIAHRESETVWRNTGDFNKYMDSWFKTYEQSLSELVEEFNVSS